MLIVRRFQSKTTYFCNIYIFQSKTTYFSNIYLNIYISPVGSGSLLCRGPEKPIYFDFKVNYLHNHEVERPIKTVCNLQAKHL